MNTAINDQSHESEPKDHERLTLQVLRKDLTAYLDLHGVFEPGDSSPTHALATISDELTERVSSILKLASVIEATSAREAAEKLEIYLTVTAKTDLQVPEETLRKLLMQTLQDLKKLA